MDSQMEPWNALPPAIDKLRQEIEDRLGEPLFWQFDSDLEGSMCVQWVDREPVVRVRDYSHPGAAEELLHILLELDGYYGLAPTTDCKHARQALTILHNLLHHAVIFPRLAAMGYPRDGGECHAVRGQLNRLRSSVFDKARLSSEPTLLALYATVYARAKRHCPEAVFDEFAGSLFCRPGYEAARELGAQVSTAIDLDGASTPADYVRILDRCLRILGLRESTETVDRRIAK